MTSIDWLKEQIEQYILTHGNLPFNVLSKLQKQAKEMHKIELGKTWDAALNAGQNRAWNVMRAYSDFDEYYNETFKKD